MRRILSTLLLVTGLLPLPSARAGQPARHSEPLPLPAGAVARFGDSRLRHGAKIEALAFTPDGRGLLAGAEDGSLVLWDTTTGRERPRLLEEDPGNCAVACSPDGRLLPLFPAGSMSPQIHLVETATGKTIDRLAFPNSDPWSARSRTPVFSPDGRYLVVCGISRRHGVPGGREAALVVYDLVLGRELGVLTSHQRAVLALAVSADGKKLASGSSDGTVLTWDASWPTLPRRPQVEPTPQSVAAAWRDLAGPDAERAWRAVWRLALDPQQSLPLLRQKLRPARAPDPAGLAALLGELEHDDFARREAAHKEIQALGEGAAAALRRRLADRPSTDLKRLLEGLLEDIEPLNAPGRLLDSRSLAVLERLGSAEAVRILQELAEGVEGHSRTEMAQEALRRLQARAAKR